MKTAAVREGEVHGELIAGFFQNPLTLTEEMTKNVDKFLLRCMKKHEVGSCDDLE